MKYNNKNISRFFFKSQYCILLIFLSVINSYGQDNFTYRDASGLRTTESPTIAPVSLPATSYDITQALPANFVRDGSVDYTTYIQKAIDTHNSVIFPNFPVLINTNGLSLKSNSVLIFKDKTKILFKPSNLQSYAILKIYDIQNVKIFSPVIVGDRLAHNGTLGEWGMGIKIVGSKNIEIHNAKITKCWGDGIYISNSPKTVTNNIVLQRPTLDFNRRNGITITGGQNVKIIDALVSNTSGVPPMCGIDIEPNNNKAILDNISILNYLSFNNQISGLQIGLSNLPGPESKSLNINVQRIVTRFSPYGIILGGFREKYAGAKVISGQIILNDVKIHDGTLPIKIGRNYHNGPAIKISKASFFRTNGGKELLHTKEMENFKWRIQQRSNTSID
ncbi:right-handed parallel beta-helix repeat-containing protein [Pedobacter ginsengisoli]|uniref:right-handed parallel beta-helix repeat-containing protein n=1 Tax=Pedobacter ginsengisoli TaxID=363852 RepID=UPI00254B5DB1|nr:right-handed parallel beta-helix repeat-containing protein [Pedobacter ginsengisoli]